MSCTSCGAALQPGALVCGACHALVFRERLEAIASQAATTTDATAALTLWREALDLLPPDSKQHAAVLERVRQISDRLDGAATATTPPAKGRRGVLASVAAGIAFAASKLKLLLLGLGKLSTLVSMFVAVGTYTLLWGWQFALGFVLCIYVHEMGHVSALRRYGIPATAPMFIPGFGALVRLKQYPANEREDARTGIAGPLWGTCAALICLGIGWFGHGGDLFLALARTAAWINLFNLAPVGSLDGGRSFRGMTTIQRGIAAGVLLVCGYISGDGLAMVLGAVAAFVAIARQGVPEQGDLYTATLYTVLGGGLAFLAGLPVATGS